MESSAEHAAEASMLAVSGLDGTRMGVGVVLWRSYLERENETLALVRAFVPAEESLHSVLDLFVHLAAYGARRRGDEDNGASLLGDLSDGASHPALVGFLSEIRHQIHQSGPEPKTLRFKRLPVFAVAQASFLLSLFIQAETGVKVDQQIEDVLGVVRAAAARQP